MCLAYVFAAGRARPMKGRDRTEGRPRRAEKEMPVFARLSAWAVTVGALVAERGDGGMARLWANRRLGSSGLQDAASPVMDDITWFHDFLLYIIAAITVFVLILLADHRGALQCAAPIRRRRAPRTTRCSRSSGPSSRSSSCWRSRSPRSGCCSVQLNVPKPDLTVKVDRQAVVLELHLSRQRQVRIRIVSSSTEKDLKPDQPRLL